MFFRIKLRQNRFHGLVSGLEQKLMSQKAIKNKTLLESDISPICRHATIWSIGLNFGLRGYNADINTCTKLCDNRFRGIRV